MTIPLSNNEACQSQQASAVEANRAYRSLNRSLPITLLKTREAVFQHFMPELQKMGLTPQQWRVLRVLNEYGNLPMSALADQSFVMLSSLSRIVRKLCRDGYIGKQQSQVDKRSYTISLTTKGKKQVADHRHKLERVYDRIAEVFGEDKLELLYELLSELTNQCQALDLQSNKHTRNKKETHQI